MKNRNYQNLTLLNVEKRKYLPHYWSDKVFKGTVVHRVLSSLHGGSFEITLTVPLGSVQIWIEMIKSKITSLSKNQIPIDRVRNCFWMCEIYWRNKLYRLCRSGFPPTSAIYLSSHLFINLFFYLDLWCVNTVFIKLAEPGH